MKNIFRMIITSLCITMIFCSCGNVNFKNHKADDHLSQAVYDALHDDVYYLYKKDENGVIAYDFYIQNETREVVQSFYEAIDNALSDRKEKVWVNLSCYIPGGREYVMFLKNYSDDSASDADLSGIKNVTALYPDGSQNKLFMDPEIYTGFKDVRYFEIDDKLQKIADEKEIDWNKIWHDLQKFDVRK